MKILSLLFSILFLFNTSSTATFQEINVPHEIDAITVYLSNAEITRKGQVSIPAGKSELVLKGISSRILEQGMKIHISNNVKVYAVSVEKGKNSYKENNEWLALEKELDALVTKEKLLSIELNSLKKEMTFLESNMRMGGNSSATTSQLDARAAYFKKNIKALLIKLSKKIEEIGALNLKKHDLFDKQEIIEDTIDKTATTIRITVINKKASNCNIKLRYLVSNAVWKPYYSLRANDNNEPIILEYQAQVYNDTGNDWNNKPITLAIMDSSADAGKPVLRPWVLDDSTDSDYLYSDEGKLSKSKGDYKGGKKVAYDIVQINDLSTRFELKELHKIPADATPHLIDVKRFTKEATYYTLSIPKIKDGAFLIAKIPDWEQMNLLEGPINLYYNDAFQGTSQLDTQQVSDTLEISLGKDDAYSVIRRKISSNSRKRLIGFNIKEIVAYEILIKNKKNKAVDIEVRDQLPVSTDKNVEVKPLQLSNAQLDVLSGQLTWLVKLKPNQTKKLLLSFSVRYPKNKRGIFRINRRQLKSPRFF